MPTAITLPIVGMDFPNARGPTRRFVLELQKPGDTLILRPEPRNPADPNAIAVDSVQGGQIGYIPAERAPLIGMEIRRGDVTAIFQGRNERGAFLRIGFGGHTPTLPPTSGSDPVADQDWWPDEEWPD